MREPVSFGAWLRQRRRALDLTQAALAQRVGCATGTIPQAGIRRTPALAAVASVLAAHLDVPAQERAAVVQVARGKWAPDCLTRSTASSAARPGRPPLRSVHGLPMPRDPLIGRDEERTAVGRLLMGDDVRLSR